MSPALPPHATSHGLHPTLSPNAPRYYGCGLIIPECLESCRVLDLGSGSGRDCYVLSQLVGEQGHVTGIDMTEAQVWHSATRGVTLSPP